MPDESAADDSSSDAVTPEPAAPDPPTAGRVEPMRSADESTTTWNADSSGDAGPQE